MTQEYRFNGEASTKYFYKILFQITLFMVVTFGGYLIYNRVTDTHLITQLVIGVFSMWGVLYLLPLVILYLNHMKHSKGIILKFDRGTNTLFYSSGDHNLTIPVENVEKVDLFLTPAAYTNFIDWQYFGKYNYSSLYTKQNGVIKLSCLVCDEIESLFPKGVIQKKKRYMPIIWTNNKITIKG